MFKHLLSILFCLLLIGCDQSDTGKSQPTPQPTPKPAMKSLLLLQDPLELTLVETPTEALINWRQHAQLKPALILISNDPFLAPIPEEYREKAIRLITKGSDEDIRQQAVNISAHPILLHDMALSAALSAGLFSEVVWLLPITESSQPPSLEEFKGQLLGTGVISQEDADSFTEKEGAFTGHIRKTAFKVISQSAPQTLTTPVVVHLDLSYFRPLYKNEVKTPLYPLLATHLAKLRDMNLQVAPGAVTLSLSNLGGRMPLAVRFLGQDLKALIKDPELLSSPLSEFWFHRQQSLFLPNFFRNEETLEHLQAMEKMAPQDASVKFALYSIHRELKKGDEALAMLETAIALDPLYALEYQNLSHTAIEKGQPLAALKMLNKATTYFPTNPLIKLALADIQLKLGQRAKALELLDNLKTLPWSEIYDSGMPDLLDEMITAANQLPENEGH